MTELISLAHARARVLITQENVSNLSDVSNSLIIKLNYQDTSGQIERLRRTGWTDPGQIEMLICPAICPAISMSCATPGQIGQIVRHMKHTRARSNRRTKGTLSMASGGARTAVGDAEGAQTSRMRDRFHLWLWEAA